MIYQNWNYLKSINLRSLLLLLVADKQNYSNEFGTTGTPSATTLKRLFVTFAGQ